jgi:hypothetical protein
MATYRATMLSGADDSLPESYPFEAPDDLFSATADKIVRKFFEHVDKDVIHHHVDYEVNAVSKSKDGATVTAMGALIMRNGSELPFVLCISPQP